MWDEPGKGCLDFEQIDFASSMKLLIPWAQHLKSGGTRGTNRRVILNQRD